MRTVHEIISHLRSLNIRLSAAGDHLEYSGPEGAMTSELRAELIEQKAEILALLQRADRSKLLSDLTIKPVPRDGDLPLSFAQQRLWFIDQLMPGLSTYNMPVAIRLDGSLNAAALEQSLGELIRRHESLRTVFISRNGEPLQVIKEATNFILPVVKLDNMPEARREAEAIQLASIHAMHVFDLAKGPLFQAKLLRLSATEHVLLLNMHHIVSDGLSMNILFRELSALYEAFSAGRLSPLPELPIQYVDFAVWQRERLQGEQLDVLFSHWKNRLDGAPPLLELPTDRPRPNIQTDHGAHQSLLMSRELMDELNALSLRSGTTLFMTLLGAFKTLLYRYTGQKDIIVGSPVANRNYTEIENLVGFFVNTLVLRTDFSDNPSFLELLDRVRDVCLDAYEHQDLPFEKLVVEMAPERNMSYSPLCQVTFALAGSQDGRLKFANLKVSHLKFERDSAKFDLTLSMRETEQGLTGNITYNTDLFNADTIDRMLKHLQTLLEGIAANPEQRISELPILAESERHQLLVEWSGTTSDYPQDEFIHHSFETYAEVTPDAVAVVCQGQQLTYEELNRRANQLAHHLQTLGIGPEIPVAIFAERSLEMVIGIMGVLKSGGAYVPIDPMYPLGRLAFMLEDTQAPVLLTQEKLLDLLPEREIKVICLDRDWELISQENDENPTNAVKPENLAYIMYTSGSTGKPKGVMITHQNVVGFLHSYQEVLLDSERRFGTSVATFSFDTSVEEIFTPLCFGGEVHLMSPEQSTDEEYFAKYLVEHQITTSYILPDFIPGVARHLNSMRDKLNFRCMITGLAPKKQSVLQSMRDISGEMRILNAYGPTEVTYGATAFEFISANDPDRDVPIGKPFPNYKVYILDSNLQLVPVGVFGELFIGGVGLARGYLNRPELTAAAFVPDPFSDDPSARLYKTGDVVRYLPDGNIDFLGRADNQVKIRGYRIELGEIETVLGNYPDISRIVVMAREDTPGDKRLAAYIVPRDGKKLTINQMRGYLKDKLPEYMIPSFFIFLEAFPLFPNGKINFRSLPVPDQSRLALEEAFVPPNTPVEKTIAGIWAQLLNLESVGIHDNFFELGGHSLMATRVVSQIRKIYQIELPLRDLFTSPNVAELAKHVENLTWMAKNLRGVSKDKKENREQGNL